MGDKQRESLAEARSVEETEYKVETTHGHTYSEEAKDFIEFHGLALRWRFRGERTWRKVTIIPQADQTVPGLLADVELMVAACARRALSPEGASATDAPTSSVSGEGTGTP